MKNLKIRMKLTLILGVAIACLLLTGVASVICMGNINAKSSRIANHSIPMLTMAEELRVDMSDFRRLGLRHVITNDAAEMTEIENSLQEVSAEITRSFEEYGEIIETAEAKQLHTQVQNYWSVYMKSYEEMLVASSIGQQEEAMEISLSCTSEYDDVEKAMTALVEHSKTQASNLSAEADANFSTANTMMIAIIVIGIALLIVGSLVLTRMITGPVHELDQVSRKIAEGDLDLSIRYDARDELGDLARSVNKTVVRLKDYEAYINEIAKVLGEMAQGELTVHLTYDYAGEFAKIKVALENISESMNDTMTRIAEASAQVAGGSDQVSSAAQALSQGATQQASSVEEIAATINEISANVNKNADRAKTAGKQASATASELEQGKQQMKSMTDAMAEIDSSANEINKIIKTIEDIAFQTNILALNAAVEAARAGQAGKGFAVVADEVRNLASKSAEASKNTAALIGATIKAVKDGAEIADQTAESFVKITQMSEESAAIVQEIAKASQEQAAAVSQVMIGIDQISSVVQTNSATAEENAASSEELSGQAQILKGLVGKFKLKNGGQSSSAYSAPAPSYEEPAPTYSAPSSYGASTGFDKY